MRYTKTDAQNMFERLAKALGRQTTPATQTIGADKIGTLLLDTNFTYGGHRIDEVINAHGAVNGFGGNLQRRNNREFCEAVAYALIVLDAYQKAHSTLPPLLTLKGD